MSDCLLLLSLLGRHQIVLGSSHFYWRRHLSVVPPLSVLSSSPIEHFATETTLYPNWKSYLSYPILYQRHASHRPTPLFIISIFLFSYFCFASVISLSLLLGFGLSSFSYYFLSGSPFSGSLGITSRQVQQTHVRAHCVNRTGRDIGDSTLSLKFKKIKWGFSTCEKNKEETRKAKVDNRFRLPSKKQTKKIKIKKKIEIQKNDVMMFSGSNDVEREREHF